MTERQADRGWQDVPLLTKLYLPRVRSDYIQRSHLTDRLEAGKEGKLTLVSAPAGFGKTTLISIWANLTEAPVAWLSLDKDDNDPVRFLTYVTTAISQIAPGIGETIQLPLQSLQLPPVESLISILINDIVAFSKPLSMVLDDYHLIEAETIHKAIAFLLDNLPPQMHLVIVSRIEPPLSLSRLRGRGQVSEIRANDLRFTQGEAGQFLNQVMGLQLSVDDVSALSRRTEGWIAGLQLAALSMRGTENATEFVASFAGDNRYIMDYLVEEVLSLQPSDVRSFLIRTSILERLCGPLCNTLTGQQDSQAILERLEATNLFIIPLDNIRRWYRYHHLFTDLLRHRLRAELADEEAELHQRASRWYETEGFLDDAIYHALAAKDFDRAIDLIRQGMQTKIRQNELHIVRKWLETLPEESLRQHPRLLTSYAFSMAVNQNLNTAETWVKRAETALSGRDESLSEAREALGEVMGVRTVIAFYLRKPSLGIEIGQEALAKLPDDNVMRPIIRGVIGGMHRMRGDVAEARIIFNQALPALRESGNQAATLTISANIAWLDLIEGQLRRAAAGFRSVLQLAQTKTGIEASGVGRAYLGLGMVAYRWDHLAEAESYLVQGMGTWTGQTHRQEFFHSWIFLIRVKYAQGNTQSAKALIREIGERLSELPSTDYSRLLAATEARLWMLEDNLDSAARWAKDASPDTADDEDHLLQQFEQLTLARLLMAYKRYEEAGKLLAGLKTNAEARAWIDELIEILTLLALCRYEQGNIVEATGILSPALSRAEPEGYIRVFVDEGLPMVRLLREAAAREDYTAYVRKLLAAGEGKGAHTVETNLSAAAQPLIESLSERELEVLRLIAAGYSNPEIAQELIIAVGTVKKHVEHIYGKLDVHNRTQAAARAAELGLL